MALNAPAIVKAGETVLVEVEKVVAQFPRYHKYASGQKLRDYAWAVATLAHSAWADSAARAERVQQLSDAIDNLKLTLQICQRLSAFRSFKQFEALVRLVSDLGRQCGGWQRRIPKSQNREAISPTGRAKTLSAHDASREANP